MITFTKIAKYDTGKNALNQYEYICKLLDQSINPPSLEPKSIDCRAYNAILCSPLIRAMESIMSSDTQPIVYREELREIAFDFRKMTSENDYASCGSNAVRASFCEAFSEDRLNLSLQEIEKQIRTLFKQIVNLQDSVIIVTHSFRMVIIESFIKTSGNLFKKPDRIYEFVNIEKKLYEFKGNFIVPKSSIADLG